MSREKSIEISYATQTEYDFGKFEQGRIGKIKVNPTFWNKYTRARYNFDILHAELKSKILFSKRVDIKEFLEQQKEKRVQAGAKK